MQIRSHKNGREENIDETQQKIVWEASVQDGGAVVLHFRTYPVCLRFQYSIYSILHPADSSCDWIRKLLKNKENVLFITPRRNNHSRAEVLWILEVTVVDCCHKILMLCLGNKVADWWRAMPFLQSYQRYITLCFGYKLVLVFWRGTREDNLFLLQLCTTKLIELDEWFGKRVIVINFWQVIFRGFLVDCGPRILRNARQIFVSLVLFQFFLLFWIASPLLTC